MSNKKDDKFAEKTTQNKEANTSIPRGTYEETKMDFRRCLIHGISYPQGETCPKC
jgi:hypothetical protein